ncbi:MULTISPECIES: hypothetical protein [unclassified Burkholderia]|uniref:hypothetical protein n=1 Tax=unclassified Burkholderia TaxID=2613784 RepID=UPI0012E396C9|nr:MULTISPECIES: hypothetical protein [unclassified Burkholderia]
MKIETFDMLCNRVFPLSKSAIHSDSQTFGGIVELIERAERILKTKRDRKMLRDGEHEIPERRADCSHAARR